MSCETVPEQTHLRNTRGACRSDAKRYAGHKGATDRSRRRRPIDSNAGTVLELVEILSQSTRDFYRFAEADSQKSSGNWPGVAEQPATRSNRACGEVIGAANLAVMRACCRLLILLAITSSILPADLTIKVRTIAGNGQASETTEYYKDSLMRRDFGFTYQVIDFSTRRSVTVDPAKKNTIRSTDRRRRLSESSIHPKSSS